MSSADGPFRTASQSCPRCRVELSKGELAKCPRCNGVWVSAAALHVRIGAMQGDKPHLAFAAGVKADGPHDTFSCVECGQLMETLRLFDVPIDRCQGHGIWFDHEELERVLFAARHHSHRAVSGPEKDSCTMCEHEARTEQHRTSKPSNNVGWGLLDVLGAIFTSL